jgi:hypothetical protein
VVAFAPLIAEHPGGTVVNAEFTGWLHRNQNTPIVGVGAPVQLPVFTVHVEPTVAPPDTVGATTLAGRLNWMDVLFTAPASAKPREFVPPSCAVRYLPTSARVDTNVVLFAPLIGAHPVGTVVYPEVMGWLHLSQ